MLKLAFRVLIRVGWIIIIIIIIIIINQIIKFTREFLPCKGIYAAAGLSLKLFKARAQGQNNSLSGRRRD